MSNISLIIEERSRSVGNFMVGRLLPFREKRAVGPFVFVDHMGPISMDERENFDILPHPHIGLSTLTYLFEGAIMHRDSIGTEKEIQPGAVNWMTAGKGIVHSERTPDRLRGTAKPLHGLQIWVALPSELEEMNPTFTHVPADELPSWQEGSLHYKLIAGQFDDIASPVPVHSKMFFMEIKSQEEGDVDLGSRLFGESALYILSGSVELEGQSFGPRQILIAKDSKLCSFKLSAHSKVYIFGGEPFDEPRHINWNFVSSRKKRIDQAVQDWKEQRFPKIAGETEWVPYPS